MELIVDEFRAAQPGELPVDGTAAVGGIRLPLGHRGRADPSFTDGSGAMHPVLWVSDDVLSDAGTRWVELRRAFRSTGLWPLMLETLDGEPRRPWDDGEFDPGSSTKPDGVDASSTLQQWWSDVIPLEEEELTEFEELRPFGRDFPGLAPPPAGQH